MTCKHDDRPLSLGCPVYPLWCSQCGALGRWVQGALAWRSPMPMPAKPSGPEATSEADRCRCGACHRRGAEKRDGRGVFPYCDQCVDDPTPPEEGIGCPSCLRLDPPAIHGWKAA